MEQEQKRQTAAGDTQQDTMTEMQIQATTEALENAARAINVAAVAVSIRARESIEALKDGLKAILRT